MTETHRDSTYWSEVAATFARHEHADTWRAYMQLCYRALLQSWFRGTREGHTLKTDLFEEAITPFNLLSDLGPHPMGMDVAPGVARLAAQRARTSELGQRAHLYVADLRSLPLASGSLARVVSGSSLDHFEHKHDIATALAELARCLAPGGCLVVTFDNWHNPVVRIRNALPFSWVRALRLVPYFVGATYSREEAERGLTALGLQVTHVSTMVHVPRAPAIWIAALLRRFGKREISAGLLRAFRFCDGLGATRVRFRTGYYLAVRAVKPPE